VILKTAKNFPSIYQKSRLSTESPNIQIGDPKKPIYRTKYKKIITNKVKKQGPKKRKRKETQNRSPEYEKKSKIKPKVFSGKEKRKENPFVQHLLMNDTPKFF
jgi:hypothetical protein